MKNWFKFLHSEFWILRRYQEVQIAILKKWKNLAGKSNKELKAISQSLQKKIKGKPAKTEKEIVTAYALMAESIFRIKKIHLHDVQILGAIALHYGNVSEMKTGEGKTLTALLPAYLNALTGKPVYIVTVNEYLVLRDFIDNSDIFNLLGLTVGKILNTMQKPEKMLNYQQNVIYITNSEIGFDYLRDNMINFDEPKMQKELFYVIIDEADSILIDEARTPLIISGRPRNRSDFYQKADQFIKSLKPSDYQIDQEIRRSSLGHSGVLKANFFFKLKNIYDLKNSELFHFISNALHANFILMKNIDYLIRDQKIHLIDPFTGRVMADRKLSEGLHQALESKEKLKINEETTILATITYQNFFRLFDKIAGMTGTAKAVEDEFIKTYNMHVLQIPTNLPIIREDKEDLFFYSTKDKYLALAQEIENLYNKGQPVLVGSSSVQTSEEISLLLKKSNIPHKVLNAKHHGYEAKIIAQAGDYQSITIATNMAGRGTDIKIDKEIQKLGGLALLGAERNESQRIDLQLRGRSGRQGEPGYSQFYVSLDDDLIARFNNLKFKKRFNFFAGKPIKSSLLNRSIKRAQQKITNFNFEQRKTLLEFDNVISQQRGVVYRQRDFLRESSDLTNYLEEFLTKFVRLKLTNFFIKKIEISNVTAQQIVRELQEIKMILPTHSLPDNLLGWTKPELENWIVAEMLLIWSAVNTEKSTYSIMFLVQTILLKRIDFFWTIHLDEIMRIKSSSFLHSYAQKRPLEKFIEESEELFSNFKNSILLDVAPTLFQQLGIIYRTRGDRKEIENLPIVPLPNVLYIDV